MMPLRSAQKDAVDKRVQAVIDFANKVLNVLKERFAVPSTLRQEVEAYIKQLPTFNRTVLAAKARTLDALGTELWNACTSLFEHGVTQPDPRIKAEDIWRLGLLVRLFSLMLLDTAHTASTRWVKDRDQQVRVMKIAIRAARLCLDRNELEYAHTCLERCSQFVNDDEPGSLLQLSREQAEDDSHDVVTRRTLGGEYYLLRLLHAWKSERIDLAEHFYSKLSTSGLFQLADLAAKAADTFYEFAKALSQEQKTELSIKWFERAFAILNDCDAEMLSQDCVELYLSVGICLVDQLLVANVVSTRHRAWEVIHRLEMTHSVCNRIIVPLTKFNILASERTPDAEQILQTVTRLTKLVVLTDDSFRLVMQTIKKAAQVSPISALTALKAFICVRIIPEAGANQPSDEKVNLWLEKATISFILYATSARDESTEGAMENIQELLDGISDGCRVKFTTKATHAAQTLVWKASAQSDASSAYAWRRVLKHTVFENAGPLNKARIARKLIHIALEEGNFTVAREVFREMPIASQNEGLTRYLAFKIALRTGDEELAMSSLNIVTRAASKDPTYLYACVLDAQQSESKHMAVAALQAILDERPTGIHLPSLLRCTARLLIAEVNAHEGRADDGFSRIVKVFETGSECMDDILSKAPGNQKRSEIQWWSKNAYNLAVRFSASVSPELLIRLLDVCAIFLNFYPTDVDLRQQDRVDQRKLLCAFLSTTALIVLGRSGDQGSDQYTMQCFLHAQQRIETYKSIRTKALSSMIDDQDNDRAFAMLKFELECILILEQWDKLGTTLQACLDAHTVDRWDALADLLIIIHERLHDATRGSLTEMTTQLLQRIINDTWKKDKNFAKVARWLRFTFVLCLEHSDGSFSFKLLEQAASMANRRQQGGQDRYPESELQWLATTSFNHAIDLLISNQESVALSWMDGALELARYADDNGSLHAFFTSRKNMALERAKDT